MTPIFIKSLKKPAKPKAEKGAAQGKDAAFAGLLALVAEHNAAGEFGPDSVEEGHHVTFKAGAFVGSGKVATTGEDGLTVTDPDGRDHRVHWHEVTGHRTSKGGNAK